MTWSTGRKSFFPSERGAATVRPARNSTISSSTVNTLALCQDIRGQFELISLFIRNSIRSFQTVPFLFSISQKESSRSNLINRSSIVSIARPCSLVFRQFPFRFLPFAPFLIGGCCVFSTAARLNRDPNHFPCAMLKVYSPHIPPCYTVREQLRIQNPAPHPTTTPGVQLQNSPTISSYLGSFELRDYRDHATRCLHSA